MPVFTDGLPPKPDFTRPRVGGGARRSALGWTKRSTGAKENANVNDVLSPGALAGENSLRLHRPRPQRRDGQTPRVGTAARV